MKEERIREIAEGDNAVLVMTPEEKIELASALLAAQARVRELENMKLADHPHVAQLQMLAFVKGKDVGIILQSDGWYKVYLDDTEPAIGSRDLTVAVDSLLKRETPNA